MVWICCSGVLFSFFRKLAAKGKEFTVGTAIYAS